MKQVRQLHTPPRISRRAWTAGALAFAAFAGAGAATAQPQVPKTIRIIVAYPAGGVSDVIARALGEKLSAALKQLP